MQIVMMFWRGAHNIFQCSNIVVMPELSWTICCSSSYCIMVIFCGCMYFTRQRKWMKVKKNTQQNRNEQEHHEKYKHKMILIVIHHTNSRYDVYWKWIRIIDEIPRRWMSKAIVYHIMMSRPLHTIINLFSASV